MQVAPPGGAAFTSMQAHVSVTVERTLLPLLGIDCPPYIILPLVRQSVVVQPVWVLVFRTSDRMIHPFQCRTQTEVIKNQDMLGNTYFPIAKRPRDSVSHPQLDLRSSFW